MPELTERLTLIEAGLLAGQPATLTLADLTLLLADPELLLRAAPGQPELEGAAASAQVRAGERRTLPVWTQALLPGTVPPPAWALKEMTDWLDGRPPLTDLRGACDALTLHRAHHALPFALVSALWAALTRMDLRHTGLLDHPDVPPFPDDDAQDRFRAEVAATHPDLSRCLQYARGNLSQTVGIRNVPLSAVTETICADPTRSAGNDLLRARPVIKRSGRAELEAALRVALGQGGPLGLAFRFCPEDVGQALGRALAGTLKDAPPGEVIALLGDLSGEQTLLKLSRKACPLSPVVAQLLSAALDRADLNLLKTRMADRNPGR